MPLLPARQPKRQKKKAATSKWAKMTSILDKMKQIKWSIKEIIQAYLMEPAEESKYASVKIRREKFIEVLLEKEEIVKILRDEILKEDVLKQLGFIHVERLRQELDI